MWAFDLCMYKIFCGTFSICVKFLHTANMMNTMTNMLMVFKMINIYWFVSNEMVRQHIDKAE